MFMGGTWFEELGFYYVGPIDGHDLDALIPVLENIKKMKDRPVLLHVVTQKGKGYAPAENSADKYHGVSKFNVITGEQSKAKAKANERLRIQAHKTIGSKANLKKVFSILRDRLFESPSVRTLTDLKEFADPSEYRPIVDKLSSRYLSDVQLNLSFLELLLVDSDVSIAEEYLLERVIDSIWGHPQSEGPSLPAYCWLLRNVGDSGWF